MPRRQFIRSELVEVLSLGFTKIVVEDLDAMAAFYRDVCGLEEEGRADAQIGGRPIRELYFRSDPPGTGTFTLTKFLDAPRTNADAVILGFIADDIESFVSRSIAAGASLVEGVQSQPQHGVKVAFVKDVEGNLIEVVELL